LFTALNVPWLGNDAIVYFGVAESFQACAVSVSVLAAPDLVLAAWASASKSLRAGAARRIRDRSRRSRRPFRADARFDVFAVVEAEADLLRRGDFGGLRGVPQRVLRGALEMPVFMPVGGPTPQDRRCGCSR
jgi:hypothetical protein